MCKITFAVKLKIILNTENITDTEIENWNLIFYR